MAEDIYEIGMLLDFYGQLLTESQYKCMDMHGAHDFIKRGRKALAEYEEKLKLLERFCEIRQNLKTIQEDLQLIDRSGMQSGNLYMLDQIDKNLFRIITKI